MNKIFNQRTRLYYNENIHLNKLIYELKILKKYIYRILLLSLNT